jgi:hypothetical protein
LFDPIDATDPRFISFNINGEAVLNPEYIGSAEAEERFEYSRLYLHLNWPRFVDDRSVLYDVILRYVERGEAGPDARRGQTLDLRPGSMPAASLNGARV